MPDDVWDAAVAALSSAGDDGAGLVVVVGRGSVAESAEVVTQAAEILADAYPSARFLPALRRGNVMGALDMGLAPGPVAGTGIARRRAGSGTARSRAGPRSPHNVGATPREFSRASGTVR